MPDGEAEIARVAQRFIEPNRPGLECYAGESNGSKHWLYDAKGSLISDDRLGSLAPKTAYWDDDQ